MPKRVLLDAGILIHSEFAQCIVKNVSVGWGGRESVLEVHGQLHPHLTQQLLWEEYRQANPDGYRYSRFCELYQR